MSEIYNEITLSAFADFLLNHDTDIKSADGVSDYILEFIKITHINDKNVINNLPSCIYQLNEDEYQNNPYYKNISFSHFTDGDWEMKMDYYKPYQGFIYNDLKFSKNRIISPQMGYFSNKFPYQAIYQNKRLWMSITPNEINTMKPSIDKANGTVLVLGLGLAYFPYMISLKDNVKKIVVVEIDESAINLNKRRIISQFTAEQNSKITIIKDDAFNKLNDPIFMEQFNFVFADLWHDASDGIDLYLRIKEIAKEYSNIEFSYWIKDTMDYYLGEL